MMQSVLDSRGFATTDDVITVFSFHQHTHEYLCENQVRLTTGVGIPAFTCIDAPPAQRPGFAVCRAADLSGWEYVTDHRGETVYSIVTGEPMLVSLPGDYPQDTTATPPATPFDAWSGSEWVTDTEAQHAAEIGAAEQQKAALLAEAQTTIGIWQTELQLGIISDEDRASLIACLNYIKAVQATDTSKAPDITWPPKPE